MTERFYYTDAYLTAFDANVVERADGGRRIYLDRTAFYPTSGGQLFDTGTIGGRAVVDVIAEGDRVAHILDAPLEQDVVRGQVDWARRFDHMQQHTGQHVLSAVFDDLFGHTTVSVHFGADNSTLDLDVPSIDPEVLVRAEARANEIVRENRPVGVHFEEAARVTGLRKAPPERVGLLRIVEVSGVDRSACGGTHVRATGEIGPIFLRKQDRIRKNARLEFVCGARALRSARADFDALSAIARTLSAAPSEVATMVATQADRLAESERQRRRLAATLQAIRAREIHQATAPSQDGVRRASVRLEAGEDAETARALAQEFSRLTRAVLVIASEDPPGIVLATTEDSGLDAAVMLRGILENAGGRGGGSARVAQGRFPDRESLALASAALERDGERAPMLAREP